MATDAPLLRLLHLVSPSLPTGAFTYSQGIEWAVESGWLRGPEDLKDWLQDQITTTLTRVDLPILARLYGASLTSGDDSLADWTALLLASRETQELRSEEANRGRALADLLVALGVPGAAERKRLLARSQATGFAYASAQWGIQRHRALLGYGWSWLEGLTLAAVKIIPLGQTQGQQVLAHLRERLPAAVEQALSMEGDAIGASSPALAIASSLHETQYTRLFRS